MSDAGTAPVHVIDDDDDARDSLAFLLKRVKLPVEVYASAAAFLEVAPSAAGVVVTDVRMPEMDGLELTVRLKEMGVALPVIVMTGHGDIPLAVEAMKAGVVDFIEKPFEGERMLNAIRAAFSRQGPDGAHDEERADYLHRIETLSSRERQVLDGLVAGKASKVIARDLDISPRTVEVYRANVMTKTKARSLSELVRMAIRAGVA
ncbi:MAG TPA: response regulator FixJ [Caulobacteraceae bacterium]|nr:response regulator FixJ [Caulobacteraceae bacterium]